MLGILLAIAVFSAGNALGAAVLRARGFGLISFARSVPASRWRAPAARLASVLLGYLVAALLFTVYFRIAVPPSSKIDVARESPAREAGIQDGDQVVEVGGTPVVTFEDVLKAQEAAGPHRSLDVVVLRGDQRITARVNTGEYGELGVGPALEPALRSWRSAAAAALAAPFRWAIIPFLPALHSLELRKPDPFDGPPLTLPREGRAEILLGLFEVTLGFYSTIWHLLALLALASQVVAAARGELSAPAPGSRAESDQ